MNLDFYKVLESIMEREKLTIPEVARRCGLSDSTVRSIFDRKQKKIALNIAFKISEGLGVSLKELNGEIENDYADTKKAPEPKESVPEAEVERLAVQLYQALLRAGLVEEGQELTERQMRAIEGICDVLSVVFDDAN